MTATAGRWADQRAVARWATTTLVAALLTALSGGLHASADRRLTSQLSAAEPSSAAIELVGSLTGLHLLSAPFAGRIGTADGAARQGNSLGAGQIVDVSWPQCQRAAAVPAPLGIVVGLTGGRPEIPNPCLAAQAAWAGRKLGGNDGLEAYLNVAVPAPDELAHSSRSSTVYGCGSAGSAAGDLCRIRRLVMAHAVAAVADGRRAGLVSGRVWLDVETANYWSASPAVNRAAIAAVVSALRGLHEDVGIYSAPGMWQRITGQSGAVDLPTAVWEATGATDPVSARAACAVPMAGGLPQWVQYQAQSQDAAVDVDLVCP